jgi:(1->4)-alpha-D-glucan 1-alpha-D-glucosylmutase
MIPSSTYRLQLRPSFDLDAAAGIVDYLARLGVGAVYTSPLLAAAPGSTHGYDVVDPTRVNPELGGDEARSRLVATVRRAGLGLVVDIVPNHMSVAVPRANPWWWDVLSHGRESRYAKYFDIDWSREPVLLPVLGDDGAKPGAEYPDSPHYRLVSWRRGNAELNYRRFFDVTTLAAVRVEDPEVFAATHALLLRWVRDGEVDGLRVDHPDGLADPGGYLRRLREGADCWLVVEKILAPGEEMPASWPVHGTTGYDALRQLGGVFVDPAGEGPITAFAAELGVPTDFVAVERESRRLVASTLLVAEIRRIAGLSGELTERAVAELMVAFPVYRSYLPEGLGYWTEAVSQVHDVDVSTVDKLVRAEPDGELAARIQQTTAMVVAKGTEDTAFYRYTRFIALNEVGGAPNRFGASVSELHAAASARDSAWPAGMTALSTHDTKRSEDVRARLAVLSELPGEWAGAVRRWTERRGLSEPSLNLLAWQSLVGAWPITAERLMSYVDKAAKEAKLRTSWVDHDEEFEAEVAGWPAAVLEDSELAGDVAAFVERIRPAGWSNSLGQKLIQLAGPGVPDVYQGTELWDLSLVDPDNRRPVDFALRAELLARLESGWLPEIDESGAAKMHVVRQVLRLRRERAELFTGYRPLRAEGPAAEHLFAFARGPRARLVAAATRLPVGLAASGGWRDTVLMLPAGSEPWTNLLTGQTVHSGPVGELLGGYPVALLLRGNR